MPSMSEQAIDLGLNFLTQHGVRPEFTSTRYFTRNAILTLKNLLLSDHDDLSTKLKVLRAKDVGDESALCTALQPMRWTGTVQVLALPFRRRRRALLYAWWSCADGAHIEQVFIELLTRGQARTISSRHFPDCWQPHLQGPVGLLIQNITAQQFKSLPNWFSFRSLAV
jgi:hypothetical protein